MLSDKTCLDYIAGDVAGGVAGGFAGGAVGGAAEVAVGNPDEGWPELVGLTELFATWLHPAIDVHCWHAGR